MRGLSDRLVVQGADSPRHFNARKWVQTGIFEALSTFRVLEKRLTDLATNGERGEAFEVFAEAYLATVAVEKAKHVWPGATAPLLLRKRLVLSGRDKGVDGVLETELGDYHAYQVKFRSGRPSLIWKELSTFIGLADRVNQRLLFTNCDRFADVIKRRKGFYAISGHDLDELEAQDFATIVTWLKGAGVERILKTPLPYQVEALVDILAVLRYEDRATVLMACGTGKTLAALWVCERMRAQIILVLVPSLALLRQTLHEWMRQTVWPSVARLCVCSDPSVRSETDQIVLRPEDLDFPVTTESGDVRTFLATEYGGVKLVFSTYQSARVVAKGMKRGQSFDLAIFDEAHKTAGPDRSSFGLALEDKRLPIKKRLFLTATPRHYDVRQRDKEGNARLVYSMDVPETYGPVAHELGFAEAARRNIICGYKVIVSVVTTNMVNDDLLRRGAVMVNGDAVKAHQVANQLALRAAVRKHCVRKIFTFHRTVASAASFTSDGSEGISKHLPGFETLHVNGSMPTSERENVMDEFRTASKALISNARCLTEGVDVPSVDMVAFLTPKRSRVDIVQAIGRAMRKSPGKATGYVLIPLFVEQTAGETIQEALDRTEFDEVWKVLRAMQEQDDILADVIKEMVKQRARIGGFDDSRFREKVEFLGPQILLEALRDSITIRCLEVLGETWDERLGQLKAYQKRFGGCDVPRGYKETPGLGKWVSRQRSFYNSGKLEEERIGQLNEIGFDWDPNNAAWEAQFDGLKLYEKRFGNCDVPQGYKEDAALGTWVAVQRARYRLGKLETKRVGRLNSIGFEWDPFDVTWEARIAELKAYRKRFGNCRVPGEYKESPGLGHWATSQRALYKFRRLAAERIRRLNEVGFEWDSIDSWEASFSRLKLYQKQSGNCDVPKNYKKDMALGIWVQNQRILCKAGKLAEKRVRRLNGIGFKWNPLDAAWEASFTELKAYQKRFGNCNVQKKYAENPALGIWAANQRMLYKSGKLAKNRTRRLDEMGFKWELKSELTEALWNAKLAQLKAFQKRSGNLVLWESGIDPILDRWVQQQRTLHNSGLLDEGRVRRLNEVGFAWHPFDAAWEARYAELMVYRKRFGDCDVPTKYNENPALGRWVQQQTARYNSGMLDVERIRRLDEIGFEWDQRNAQWESNFAELKLYRKRFGNCGVPLNWGENPVLARWVMTQRKLYKSGNIDDARARLMNELGFEWDPFDAAWEARFDELKLYQKRLGNANVPKQYIENPALGNWVSKQRKLHRSGKLERDRFRLLSKLGFRWGS